MSTTSGRELICQAIQAKLEAALTDPEILVTTTVSGRPVPAGQAVTVLIDWSNEDAEHLAIIGAPLRQRRRLSLAVETRVKAADDAVQRASRISALCEAALGADNVQVAGGARSESLRFTGASKGEDASGSHRLVVVVSSYEVSYRVNADAPHVLIN